MAISAPDSRIFDTLCTSLLRKEAVSWPFADDPEQVECFLQFAGFHGVESLVFEYLPFLQTCPEKLGAAVNAQAKERAVWELRNRALMHTALAALSAAGIPCLLYKGTALAYALYANPVWRTRSDSDLLIPPYCLARAIQVLEALGWRQMPPTEEIIWYKLFFTLIPPEGGEHNIDLHWRLNNAELLAGLFDIDELLSCAKTVPALGPTVRTLDPVHALLIACLHRGVHKLSAYTAGELTAYTGDRLIWLLDIHLLAAALEQPQWHAFCTLAHQKGLNRICQESLLLAQQKFDTSLPSDWQEHLSSPTPGVPDRYLAAGPLSRLWLDLLACRTWSGRAGYLHHLLFPPAEYMHNKYQTATMHWLPWLYLRRMVEGLLLRLRLGRERQ